MLSNGAIQLTFKQAVQSLFLSITDCLSQPLDGNTSALIISDLKILLNSNGILIVSVGQQISDLLVIDLSVTDTNGNCLIELVACESIQLSDGSWHNTSVLEDS